MLSPQLAAFIVIAIIIAGEVGDLARSLKVVSPSFETRDKDFSLCSK